MNQIRYMLPHIFALSTSSPFWAGTDTGLLAYRPIIFKNMPRTGMPEEFESWGEYERTVNILVEAGIIEDATKLWWDIRPSARYPTLEMRISDVCTRLDDAMTVAAFYLCLLGFLFRLRQRNQRWRVYSPFFISENMWRAQLRDGRFTDRFRSWRAGPVLGSDGGDHRDARPGRPRIRRHRRVAAYADHRQRGNQCPSPARRPRGRGFRCG